ncbi:MAG: glycosyltransferase family 4 protein [Clostridiales bacterium]|nr:glycosyltransferase family 4 protein [Clostridiales bacterium]
MRLMEIIGKAEGGMKRHYISLCRGLIDEGAEVFAICNFSEDDTEDLKLTGIHVIKFPFSKTIRPFLNIWKLIKLIYYIRKTKPQLIHCHGFKAGFFGRMAGWLNGTQIPLAYTVHNFVTFGRGKIISRFIQVVEKWMGEKTHKIICVSKALKTSMNRDMGIPEGKLHVVYNAIPALPAANGNSSIREKYNIGDNEWIVGTVARLIPSKGIHILLTAMSGILFKCSNAKLLIVGSGPEEIHLKKLAESLGIFKQIIFAGNVSNIQDYYASFNIFVLPTLTEGLGITVLEAMYFGLPIIASSVGGIPEWLTHEKNGILIPPDNAFALRIALQSFFENPELAKKYGWQAKQDIHEKGLSESEMIRQTWAVLHES